MTNSPWVVRIGLLGDRTVGRAAKVRLSIRVAYALLALMMLGYLLLFSLISFRLHDSFITSADDLSNIDQVVWNSWHGDLLIRTTGTRQLPRYGEHLEPIWIALGPLFFFWNDVKVLLLLQTLAISAGALPSFWLGRTIVEGWQRRRERATGMAGVAGLVLAGVYLSMPFLHRANIAEVHAAPFAVAPLLFAFWYGAQGQYRRVWPFALLVLLVKEEQALLVAMLGLWIALFRRRREGILLFGLSMAWLYVAVFGIIARFAEVRTGTTESIFFGRYAEFGETPGEILVGFLTQPGLVFQLFATPERLRFLGELIAATGGLVLVGLDGMILVLPLLILNLASDYFAQYSGLQHYAAPLVPGLIAATAIAGRRLLRRVAPQARRAATAGLLLWLAGSGGATAIQAGFFPVSKEYWLPEVTAHHRLLARFIGQIPADAPLSASRQLHPHLAHRRYVTRFPTVGEASWVLVDVTSDRHVHPADVMAMVDELLAGGWGVVDAADGYLLLREGAGRPALPDAFFSFGLAEEAPAVTLDLTFSRPGGGELLRVRGYSLERDFWGRVGVNYVVEPLAPLPPGTILWPMLLDTSGAPVPETVSQPLVLSLWKPVEEWQPGERYLIKTLPREVGDEPFRPALGVAIGEWTGGERLVAGWGPAEPVLVGLEQGAVVTLGEWQRAGRGFVPTWRDWHRFGLSRAPEHRVEARAGDEPIAFRGWDGPTQTTDGRLPIRLVWQALGQPSRDLTVFVHLVPAGGPPLPVAQADLVPTLPTAAGPQTYPTSRWQPGELVLDEIVLEIGEVPPGRYRLLAGLYDPADGRRVELAPDDGDGALALGDITIVKPDGTNGPGGE